MQRILRILATTAVAWASLPGCVHTPPEAASAAVAAASPGQAAAPPQSRLDASLMYELLLGEFSFNEGESAHASAYMLDAARRTGEPALYKRAVDMAIQSRSGPAALEAVRAWRQALPDSAEARRYELQVLLALGRAAESADALRAVLDTLAASEREPFIIALPALYQRAPDKGEAAQAIEQGLAGAIEDPALAPAAWTTIGRMRLQAGDRAGALAAAILGADADAASQWPPLLALQLFAGADEPRAEAVVKRHLARPDARPDVQLAYVRALVTLGRVADAQAQLAELTTRKPDEADAWLVQGLVQAEQREDAQAEISLQRYLSLMRDGAGGSKDPSTGPSQARLALARIAERGGDLDQAERWLAAVDAPDQVLAAQIQRAGLLARQGQMARARQAIRTAPEQDEGDARVKLLAETQLLREHGEAAEALRLLQRALQDNPNDDDLLYDAAMSAERLDRLGEMERLLRRVIALKPESAHAYNALGYALADRGLRLAEARTLIEKAARLDPEDAYIQDSLGWVEFRLGQPAKARNLLEAAYRKRPDAEIAAHLGEVLWTLGEHEAARRTWREGLRLDPDNTSLQRTLRRFRVQP